MMSSVNYRPRIERVIKNYNENIRAIFGIGYQICHVCSLQGDKDYKVVAFINDESETGYCIRHIQEALQHLNGIEVLIAHGREMNEEQ